MLPTRGSLAAGGSCAIDYDRSSVDSTLAQRGDANMVLREKFQADEIEAQAASARAAVESAAGKMQAVQHGVLSPRAAGCGFVTTFSLPFARTDVYRELARVDRPLGVGMDAHCEVTDGYGKPAVVLTLGCVRRISFDDPADGSTTSQLVAHRPDSELTWRQLQCDVRIGLVGGTEEGSEPVCSISLDDSAEGTLVSIHYAFHRVAARGPICLLLPCLGPMIRTQMQEGVPREWKEEMLQRGYTPETVQKRALSGSFKAPRSDAQRRLDSEEEALLKARALAKARAALENGSPATKHDGR